jgi:hypothetical protein
MVDGIVNVKINDSLRRYVPSTLRDELMVHFHDTFGHPGVFAMIQAINQAQILVAKFCKRCFSICAAM